MKTHLMFSHKTTTSQHIYIDVLYGVYVCSKSECNISLGVWEPNCNLILSNKYSQVAARGCRICTESEPRKILVFYIALFSWVCVCVIVCFRCVYPVRFLTSFYFMVGPSDVKSNFWTIIFSKMTNIIWKI